MEKKSKKKKIIIAVIVIFLIIIGVGSTTKNRYSVNSNNKQEQTTTKVNNEPVQTPVKTQAKQQTPTSVNSNYKKLGTTATPSTGKIEINIGTYAGIENVMNVMPELSSDGNFIGSYGTVYYNSNGLTNETIVKFYNDVVLKSNCNYITLINTQNPNKGISISSAGTLSKGTLDKRNGYIISHDDKLAIIDSSSKTFTWQNP